MKKLRFIRPFRAYSPGVVLEVPGGLASELIARGYAVEDKQLEIETAAAEPEMRTADATPRKRRRAT